MANSQTGQLIAELYTGLKMIVEKNPDAHVGESTVMLV